MVVSVPIKNKFLSLSDTRLINEVVGAPDTTVALISKAPAIVGFQVYVAPFLTVATSNWP